MLFLSAGLLPLGHYLYMVFSTRTGTKTMNLKTHIDAAFRANEEAHKALVICRNAATLGDAKAAHFECGRYALEAGVAAANSNDSPDAMRAHGRAQRAESFAAATVGRWVTFG